MTVGDPEVRKVTALKTVSTTRTFDIEDRLIKFSKWTSALKAVAQLKRVAQRLKMGKKAASPEELLEAENFIIKSVQSQAFEEEISALTNNVSVKGTSPMFKLNPFVDESGVIRVGGRLQKASIPDKVKHPIILPRDSHVSKLLVEYLHDRSKHQGRGITLNEVRSTGYWIIGGSKMIQSLIHKCVICRKLRRNVEEQKMADLPEERTEPSTPFTYCGMDCFGPYTVKKGRKEVKRYGLIITCLCCRGIHVEMLEDMSTDALINALRCFIAIRGPVRQLRCDQGSNFIGARNELKEALKETERIEACLAENQCEFVFNAPTASHAAGIWERQIKQLKVC